MTNPVDEAARDWWVEHILDEVRDHVGAAHDGFKAGAEWAIQQERSRYEGLLTLVLDALRENITTWITVHPLLNEPYPDAPRWTPWTQFGKRAADRAVEAQAAIRAVLYAAPPATPSAPAEKED